MGLADQTVIREQAVEVKLAADAISQIAAQMDALACAAEGELTCQQVSIGAVTTDRRVHVRYEGSDAALVVAYPKNGDATPALIVAQIEAGFEAAYRQRFACSNAGQFHCISSWPPVG